MKYIYYIHLFAFFCSLSFCSTPNSHKTQHQETITDLTSPHCKLERKKNFRLQANSQEAEQFRNSNSPVK